MSATTTTTEMVLIGGQWTAPHAIDTFQAFDPTLGTALPAVYPVSSWEDCDTALEAAYAAFEQLRRLPGSRLAGFLNRFADEIEKAADSLVALAVAESGLPAKPRLADVELPRTCNQLRLAAKAAETGSWANATIDTKAGIRACFESIGPVCVFGPNNFPFAFNSVAGGDFAAAIAAGCPVIGKANSSHPGTTKRFAELALEALKAEDLPLATVQLLYRTTHDDGLKLVADPRVGATGYTGSRSAGLRLKTAADAVGKPIYLELSSVNPVVILSGALEERGDELVNEYVTSVLMGAGQFCTNPGLVLVLDDEPSRKFINEVANRFASAPSGTLLSPSVRDSLGRSIKTLRDVGAEVLVGGENTTELRCCYANTLMRVSAGEFIKNPEGYQTEAFGNAALVVVAGSIDDMDAVLNHLEGNLTGCIYSAKSGADDPVYDRLAAILTKKVGRMLNDKMPTGVAVSAAMNHGGPFPCTGHPGFTAVGIPASIHRFGKLTSYDNVRPNRLPPLLQDKNLSRETWRNVDGTWTTNDVT